MIGECKCCSRETEDEHYIFCDSTCQLIWYYLKEVDMGQYDIDMEVYKAWLEEKIIAIEAMSTREEIETRVREIQKIEFLAKREWALLHQHWDKITGRKGIAPWIKAERDGFITDPNIKVDWEGDPRKRDKKPKVKNDLGELLGIDMSDLNQKMKAKEREKKGLVPTGQEKEKVIKEKPADPMSLLLNIQPKKEVPKISAEEVAKKAEEMRERIRIAKEAREKKD